MELKDSSKKVQQIIAIYQSLERNETIKRKWMDEILKDWRKEEVLTIAKTGGQYIGQPFRDKKGGHPFKKYRKFTVPVGWCLGVWTGATLSALMKAQKQGGIDIIKKVTGDSIEYGYEASHSYINFNIGVTQEWLNEQTEFLTNKTQEYIEKNLRAVMQ